MPTIGACSWQLPWPALSAASLLGTPSCSSEEPRDSYKLNSSILRVLLIHAFLEWIFPSGSHHSQDIIATPMLDAASVTWSDDRRDTQERGNNQKNKIPNNRVDFGVDLCSSWSLVGVLKPVEDLKL